MVSEKKEEKGGNKFEFDQYNIYETLKEID